MIVLIKEVCFMYYQDKDSREYVVYEQEGFNKFLVKVFKWMFLALLTSGFFSYVVEKVLPMSVVGPVVFAALMVEIVIVVWTYNMKKFGVKKIFGMFIAYSITNGISLSIINYKFSVEDMMIAFFAAAIFFGVMVLYGLRTDKDLTSLGTIGSVALIAIIILTIANIFLGFSVLDLILEYMGVAVFLGLTAYDINMLKSMYYESNGLVGEKEVLLGAFSLYLEFVNLFIRVLRILKGKEK